MRYKPTRLVAVLLGLALAISVGTAVRILTLPEVGSVRHPANTPGSALDELRSSYAAVGVQSPGGVIQRLISSSPNALTFRGATYWTDGDIDSERNNALGAGGFIALVLVLSAFAVHRRTAETPAAAGGATSARQRA